MAQFSDREARTRPLSQPVYCKFGTAADEIPLVVLMAAFDVIPTAGKGGPERKRWLAMGHATYEANPTQDGFAAWNIWSEQAVGVYDAADQIDTWNKFEPYPGGKTRATLFAAAYEADKNWWKDGGEVQRWHDLSQIKRSGKPTPEEFAQAEKEHDMPYGFTMNDKGLWFQPPPDKEGGEVDPVKICDPFKMLYRVTDHNTGEYGTFVEITTRDDKKVEKFVPDSLLHDMSQKLANHLATYGFVVFTNKFCRDKLQVFFNLMTARNAVCTTQSGWVDNVHGQECFVLPSGQVLGGDGLMMRPERRMACCEPSGTLQEWQDNVARLAVGNSRLGFAISVAFASVLMKPTNTTNGGFHMYSSQSSTGKTTVQACGGSVFGQGKPDGGYVFSWRGTDNAQEAVVARVNDCLLILDEMGEARPDVVDQIIYMIGNGTGKARMRQDASLRNNYTWRILFLSTGEIKAEDMIKQANKSTTEGIGVRLANIPALVGGDYGVFEHLHEMQSSAELATHLGRSARRYYGTAIVAFMTEFLKDRETNLATLDAMTRQFMKQYANYGGQIGRVAERFALAAAAGEMAAVWDIVPWETGARRRNRRPLAWRHGWKIGIAPEMSALSRWCGSTSVPINSPSSSCAAATISHTPTRMTSLDTSRPARMAWITSSSAIRWIKSALASARPGRRRRWIKQGSLSARRTVKPSSTGYVLAWTTRKIRPWCIASVATSWKNEN
jgi:putative DNA primase/helicase